MNEYVNDSIIGITYGSKGSRVPRTGRGRCTINGEPCPDNEEGVNVPEFDVKVPESNTGLPELGGLDPVVIVAAVGLLLIMFKKRK